MKKSIKKACSIALLLTSTVALTGANALVVDHLTDNANAQIYAEPQQTSGLVTLNLPTYSDSVTLGDDFTIPTPTLTVGGNDVTKSANIETIVKDSIGREVQHDGGTFKVEGIGKYTITYNVTYEGQAYSTSITVKSSVSENSIELVENTQQTLPGDVYKSFLQKNPDANIYIPDAKVVFADKDLALDYEITTVVTSPSKKVIGVIDVDGKDALDKADLLDDEDMLEEGIYSVTYTARTTEGVYLDSKTVEFSVITKEAFESKYGSLDYKLSLDYSSTAPSTADIGQELVLPKAVARIGDQETPSYYTVKASVFIGDTLKDVTSDTISQDEDGNYVFTAQKKYTIDGSEKTVTNGRYQIYYYVTDALGKSTETSFVISGVKDTQAPSITVTDGYELSAVSETVEDKSYELQNNFQLGKNVVIKAAYAEDLSDDFADLKIERYIRKSNATSSQTDVYSDEDSDVENAFTKDIVFNKTEDYVLQANEIDGGALEDGTYTVYYRATDSAGNTNTVNYTFVVDSGFEFKSKTTVEFQDTFRSSINRGEKVTFSAPLATNDDDERLQTKIYYTYDNVETTGWDAWTLLEPNEDGKYVVPTDVEGAKKLTIRAMAISDAKTTADETNVDTSFDITDYKGIKYGFDEVTISIVDNLDTKAPNIVSIEQWDGEYTQNDDVVIPSITVSDDLIENVVIDVKVTHVAEDKTVTDFAVENGTTMTTAGQKTYSGASFYANLAGDYNVVYEITDAANRKICLYQTVTVTQRDTSSQPHFGNLPESLNGGTLEFGETLTLPIPELPKGDYAYSVDYRGPAGCLITKEIFQPKTEGTYTIVYSLYQVSTSTEVVDQKEFTLEVKDTTNPTARVEWDLDASYKKGESVMIPVFTADDYSDINLKDSTIVISAENSLFRRTINGDEMATEFAKGEDGELYVPLNYNSIYTVTYTIYDNSKAKNSTVITKTINVGDLVDPTITLPDNLVPSDVKIDTTLTINIAGTKVTDTNGDGEFVEYTDEQIKQGLNIKVVGPNNETLDNLNVDEDDVVIKDGEFKYYIDAAGTYTVTISFKDDAGRTGELTRTFTVSESSVTPLSDNEIITIVLICVAVLVLAGAVVYAIISSKNTKAYKQ